MPSTSPPTQAPAADGATPLSRSFVVVAVALTLLSTAALGSICLRRWSRALLWLAIEWSCYALLIAAIAHSRPTSAWLEAAAALLARMVAAADTWRLGRRSPRRASWLAIAAGWALVAGGGAVGASLVRAHVVEAFKTPSASMLPTLQPNDHFFVDKRAGKPRRGDVVVFTHPRDAKVDYVKRVVAVGGDTVAFTEQGLVLNGKPVAQRHLTEPRHHTDTAIVGRSAVWEETMDGRTYRILRITGEDMPAPTTESQQVPEDSVFVVGDNRDNSHDSRHFGPVTLAAVKGRALFIWWSSGEHGTRWQRINQLVE